MAQVLPVATRAWPSIGARRPNRTDDGLVHAMLGKASKGGFLGVVVGTLVSEEEQSALEAMEATVSAARRPG